MKREWKPGDVAMLADSRLEWAAAKDSKGWFALDPRIGWVADGDRFTIIRPLVVIDPEDREAVERLARLHHVESGGIPEEFGNEGYDDTATMQAALREFANPTPPKPDEPGKYGVVIAGDGREWVRYSTSEMTGRDWVRADASGGTAYARWDDLDVVRVVHEGSAS